MTRQVFVNLSDTIEAWRQKTNAMSNYLGDLDTITNVTDSSIVDAISELGARTTPSAIRNQISLVVSGTSNHTSLSYDPSTGIFNFVSNNIDFNDIPDLPASKITTGIFAIERIPDFDACKIVSGIIDSARFPPGIFDNTSLSTTDDLPEGSSNLYFTNFRARSAISSGSPEIIYNPSTGVIEFAGGADSSGNVTGGTGVSIVNNVVSIGQPVGTTDDVTFGDVAASTASGNWIATQAEAEAGTLDNVIMTPLKVKQAINAIASGAPAFVETSFFSITYGGQYIIDTAILGGIPDGVTVELQNITEEDGYVPGDIVEIAITADPAGSNEGTGVVKTATSVIVRVGNNGPGAYTRKDNGGGALLNPTRWNMRVKAFRFLR